MLAEILMYLFPGIKPGIDFQLAGDAGGQRIAEWNYHLPQPTKAEIDAAMLPAIRAAVIEQINTEASLRILESYPLEKQSSANLGIYPQAYTDKMIADIAAVIQASNDACDAVLAAVDVVGVGAVTVNWPVIGA